MKAGLFVLIAVALCEPAFGAIAKGRDNGKQHHHRRSNRIAKPFGKRVSANYIDFRLEHAQ